MNTASNPASPLESSLWTKSFPVGPLQCNCTIIGDLETGKALVFDPGGSEEKILSLLAEKNLTPIQIYHTHAHFDHFLASGALQKATGATLALHPDDLPLWNILEKQCSMFGVPYQPAPPPNHWLSHEEEISLSPQCCGKALHTPGHTPGSMSFSFDSLKLLVAGDTLFKGAIGRTDLWGGDFGQIQRSIKKQLYTLDEATRVITGHGGSTTIGDEVRNNPFVRGTDP